MYVIEGSTLGGRIILKHIHTALGLDENKGASFFAGYGAETGIRWKKIMNIMSGYAVANKCEDEVIAGACHAFESIDKYFALNSSVHED
jgi:heme oxygenase